MNRSLLKTTARVVLAAFLFQLLGPTVTLWALTGGPTQPEFSSFEPVTTTNMVNPLTGQFTYNLPVVNIPGPNGGGYSLSLSYHSGVSPEEEASWVGYGWTLNPGAITRAKRGFPDEYNGEKVRYWNRAPKNETINATFGSSIEIFSTTPEQPPPTINPDYGASLSLRYNTHKGFSFVAGVRAYMKGLATIGFSAGDEGGGFTADVSVGKLLNSIEKLTNPSENDKEHTASTWHKWASRGLQAYQNVGYQYLQYSVAGYNHSPHYHPYKGNSTNVKLSVLSAPGVLPAGVTAEVDGSYAWQENDPFIDRSVYGYMYSGNAKDDGVMDYYVEKDAPFDKRDRFLGVPFSNADYFNVSGEGMGGGFRLYNSNAGQFHPNAMKSRTGIINASANVHVGQNLGLGISIGAGRSTFQVRPWNDDASDRWKFAAPGSGDESVFFRMNNDLGGVTVFAADDDAYHAGYGIDNKPQISAGEVGYLNELPTPGIEGRNGRSSYIAYNTVGKMKGIKGKGGAYRPDLLLLEDNDFSSYLYLQQLPNSAVGEISITNPSGTKYTYGLPVIALEERQLQYGLDRLSHTNPTSEKLVNSYVPELEHVPTLTGQESLTPYVSEYLLTSVANANYVDRTHDGFSDDDFGGWVRFSYKPTTLHAENYKGYYKWRMPYKGLDYEANRFSNRKDDLGGAAMGKKGIFYLSSIETKSHVALFYTNGYNSYPKKSFAASNGSIFSREWWRFLGSSHIRKDGYPALNNEREASNGNRNQSGVAVDPTTVNGVQKENPLKRLEKIELWSKGDDGKPKELLQTVHFEYTYELCKGLPNSYTDQGQSVSNGKLTLKRVYFEYNGTVDALISPYVFGYEYRQATDYAGLPDDIKTKYNSIISYADDLDADPSIQNPDYARYHTGRWGYYQYDGENRVKNLNPWEHQHPPDDFDPAAWNLKWIRLPSGGEIQIQYEQNEYGYVQDQPAMVMTSLTGYSEYDNGDNNPRRFYLNLTETFGVDFAGDEARNKLIEAMKERFITKGEKIYFRLLHSLDGQDVGVQSAVLTDQSFINELNRERLEILDGYAKVEDVGYDNGKLYVQIAAGEYSTPDQIVKDFIEGERGRLNGQKLFDASGSAEGNVRLVLQFLSYILGDGAFNFTSIGNDVGEIDYNRSWLRIPVSTDRDVVRAKKGGGIRVRNLLMYDPGINGGLEGHLFGTTYLYETEQGYTSGVAANEPAEGKEENALVKLLDKREDQGWLEKAIVGRDKETFEGPIGESLLPGPAVVYSRVVAKNIHEGKTSPGFTIHEYYTARDFPSQVLYGKDQVGNKRVTSPDINRPFPVFLWTPFGSLSLVEQSAFQGYSFILNGMHGQIKRVATYGGDYDVEDPNNRKDWVESSMQEYHYFSPGEKIPVLKADAVQPSLDEIEEMDLGKEAEVVFEGRELNDEVIDVMGHVDASISLTLPFVIPFISGGGNLNYSNFKLQTHVTCKVIRYPVVVKKVVARQDGIESVTENIAFSPLTGDPVVTQTTDEYNGLDLEYSSGVHLGPAHDRVYRSFTYPAPLEYPLMGQKAISKRGKVIQSNSSMAIGKYYGNGRHYLVLKLADPGAVCDAAGLFSPGDLIRITTNMTNISTGTTFQWKIGDYHVESAAGTRVVIQPYSTSSYWMFFLGPYFSQTTVTPGYQSDDLRVEILKSGKTNQLNTARGSITTYGPAN